MQQNWHWAVKTVSSCFRTIKKKKKNECHHTPPHNFDNNNGDSKKIDDCETGGNEWKRVWYEWKRVWYAWKRVGNECDMHGNEWKFLLDKLFCLERETSEVSRLISSN